MMGGDDRLRHAFHGRVSAQRLAIAAAADAMPGAFSAEELIAAVRTASPGTGAATVYRALAAMTESGFIEQVGVRDGAALFVRCRSGQHHHHVVCTSCGAVAETDCELDEVLGRLGRASGYEVTSHELTVRGVCPRCACKTVSGEER